MSRPSTSSLLRDNEDVDAGIKQQGLGGTSPAMTAYGSAGAKQVGFMIRYFRPLCPLITLTSAAQASAAQSGGEFQTFVSAMGRVAHAADVPRSVIDPAFSRVTDDTPV